MNAGFVAATWPGDSSPADNTALDSGLLPQLAADAARVARADRPHPSVAVLRRRARSTVLEYQLGDRRRVIAKHYAEPAEAAAAHDILGRLVVAGFAAPARHRVPLPLGCFDETGVLLMTSAPGARLAVIAGEGARWHTGVRAAGAWLADLHSLAADIGPRPDPAQAALRLSQRAARACAVSPDAAPLVDRLLDELAEREKGETVRPPSTPTHGRYHPGHVFVADDCVTVVDLDRAAIGDPAADVGEFLFRLGLLVRRCRLDEAERDAAAREFLAGYTAGGRAALGGLAYHWSYSVLSRLFHLLEVGHPRLDRRVAQCLSDFADVPQRTTTLASSTEAET